MSLILDALRKMDQERKAKRGGSTSLRSDVLSYRGSQSTAERSLVMPITVIAVTLLGLSIGGYFFIVPKAAAPVTGSVSAETVPTTNPTAPVTVPAPVIAPAIPQVPRVDMSSSTDMPRKKERVVSPSPIKPSLTAVVRRNGEGGITLSGIAWQDERHLRRAVVNGFLMEEGAEVQGAKIIEIREGAVRFSKGGEVFEIVHNSGPAK